MLRTTLVGIDIPNQIKRHRSVNSEFDVGELIAKVRSPRERIEVYAYADATMMTDALKRHLEQHDVKTLNIPCRKNDGTGSEDVDNAMAADVVEWSLLRPEVYRIVLATADGDFRWALIKARKHGKRISVAAVEGSLNRELEALVRSSDDGQVIYLRGVPSPRLLAERKTAA